MNLPFFIAKRYLFSKKKQNIINIISWISMCGIIIGTMAIIIIISVMNGFSDLIGIFYSNFDPDIKITSVEGKMFDPDSVDIESLKSIPGVVSYGEVVEEIAILRYGKQQCPVTIKGVPENYANYTKIDQVLLNGSYYLEKEGIDYAIIGRGIANSLSIGLSFLEPIHIYVPKKGKKVIKSLNPSRSFNHGYIYPSAIYSVLEDIDAKYILVSKAYATKLFKSGNNISSIELDLDDSQNHQKIQKAVQNLLGNKFHVKNKEQQHDLIFKTMKSEKWAVYFILIFILILASGNMIGNLTMLYIDKKEDISILRSMGLTPKNINRIFLYEGWLISLAGGVIGTILGVFICWLQMHFGLLKLPGSGGSFVISAYPVHIIFSDIISAFIAVLIIGFLASWYPVKFMSSKKLAETNIE